MIDFDRPGPRDTKLEKSWSSLFLQRVADRIGAHCAKGDKNDDDLVIADLLSQYHALPKENASPFVVFVKGTERTYMFTQQSRARYEVKLRVREVRGAVKTAQAGALHGNAGISKPEQAQHRADLYKKLLREMKRS